MHQTLPLSERKFFSKIASPIIEIKSGTRPNTFSRIMFIQGQLQESFDTRNYQNICFLSIINFQIIFVSNFEMKDLFGFSKDNLETY